MILKSIVPIIVSVGLIFGLISCEKEFLDRTPYDSVTFDDAITNEDEMGDAINGMYQSLQTFESFGGRLPLMGDIMPDNAYISVLNSGRYITYNTHTILSNGEESDGMWKSMYNTILRTNQIIEADLESSPSVDQFKGEALTIRALCYFGLSQVFAKRYDNSASSNPGVPIVLEYSIRELPERNSVQEVYSQVISDLQAAIGLLTVEVNSEYVSVWFAKGLLAKVYQYKGDWTNAHTMAMDVVDNSGHQLIDSANYNDFWSTTSATVKSETLFEVSIDGVFSLETLFSLYNQEGYGDALVNDDLYNLYSSADVRKQLMYEGTHQGDTAIIADKYRNFFTAENDDIKILRLSEVYLILAEAHYNLGDEPMALTALNTLAQLREPSFAGYTSSGAALLDDITTERRKELAFEGNRFFDLNRLGLNIMRNAQYPPTALSLPFSDHRRIFPIPIREINANPNIKQNSGY